MGVVAKYAFERLLKIPLEVDVASEFRYRDPILDDKTLVIIISQSGETADTLAALRMAKGKGCRILSIVNVVGSTIANESDDVLYTWAGPEIAVASTKAYSTQLAVIYMIALYMADQLGTVPEADMARYMADLQRLPDLAEAALADKETIQYFASRYFNAHDMYFIGRNVDYAASLEASLKLKEISYIHSEAYTAGELKHGPISLLEDGTLVIAIATYEKLFDKMMSNVREVKARGAVVLGITVRGKEEALKAGDGLPVLRAGHHRLYAAQFEHSALAAVRLLRGQHEGLRHRQAQESGQVCHRGIKNKKRKAVQMGGLFAFGGLPFWGGLWYTGCNFQVGKEGSNAIDSPVGGGRGAGLRPAEEFRPQRERFCQRRLWAEPAGVFQICSVAQKKFPGP